MNGSGINKVFLIGYVAKPPRRHHDHWRLVLVTPETYNYNGKEMVHEERHVVHLSSNLRFVPEMNQWLFIEGKVHTAMHLNAGVRHYRATVHAHRLTLLTMSVTAKDRVA